MYTSFAELPFRGSICGIFLILALVSVGHADVVSPPTVEKFAVWKDANGDGQWQSGDSVLTCVTNMLQYVCAGQSYNYKQYNYPAGADLSGHPSSGDGLLLDQLNHTTGSIDTTWIKPQANSLQFWMGWAQLDHNTDNAAISTSPKGFNLGIIMNAEPPTTWDNTQQKMVHHITAGIPANNVQLGIKVRGSLLSPLSGESKDPATLAPRVVVSDDFSNNSSLYFSSFSNKELPAPPTPTTAAPYPTLPGQELVPDSNVPAGWQSAFDGNWTYNTDTTGGGVIGNLRPDPANLGGFIIAITLGRLYDPALGPSDPNGIKNIVFYSFPLAPGTYDPNDPATYNQAAYTEFSLDVSQFHNGDTLFITGVPPDSTCCDNTAVPEPVTVAFFVVGGLGLAGLRVWRSRRGQHRS